LPIVAVRHGILTGISNALELIVKECRDTLGMTRKIFIIDHHVDTIIIKRKLERHDMTPAITIKPIKFIDAQIPEDTDLVFWTSTWRLTDISASDKLGIDGAMRRRPGQIVIIKWGGKYRAVPMTYLRAV
jgi:hypothetical protein